MSDCDANCTRHLASRAVSFGIVTALCCACIRIAIEYREWDDDLSFSAAKSIISHALAYAITDWIAIGIATLCLLLCIFLFRIRSHIIIHALSLAIFFPFCIAAIISVETIHFFDSPLTFPMIVFSDFFGNVAGRHLIAQFIPTYIAVALPVSLILFMIVGMLINQLLVKGKYHLRLLLVVALAALVCAAAVRARARISDYDTARAGNAAFVLISSLTTVLLPEVGLPKEDIVSGPTITYTSTYSKADVTISANRAGQLRNVLVFVLESVGARYLDIYNGEHNVTPNLRRLSAHAVIFRNAYVPMPNSEAALMSIFSSRYPFLSFEIPTKIAIGDSWPTISTELRIGMVI